MMIHSEVGILRPVGKKKANEEKFDQKVKYSLKLAEKAHKRLFLSFEEKKVV